MLYLTQAQTIGPDPLPGKEWLDVVLKSVELIADYTKQGKVVFHGAYAGQRGSCIIWNVDSHEELMSLMTKLPYWSFMDWDVVPLLSTEQTIASIKQNMASL